MKNFIPILLLACSIFGQKNYEFLLVEDNLKKFSGENYLVIKSELDKMLNNYKADLKLDKYWLEKYKDKVYTGKSFDEDGYLTLLLNMNNPSQYEADILKRSFIKDVYKTIEKERNRVFNKGEKLFTKKAQWSDIISHFGGYAEIGKKGIKKADVPLYNIDVIFEKIELINQSECLAHIIIKGSDDALKIHNVPKANYKYKGSYKINYDINYASIYKKSKAWIDIIFNEKIYLPKKHCTAKINIENDLPSIQEYQYAMNLMFDDLIDNKATLEAQGVSKYKFQYKIFYGIDAWEDALKNKTLNEIDSDIKKALKKARIERMKLEDDFEDL